MPNILQFHFLKYEDFSVLYHRRLNILYIEYNKRLLSQKIDLPFIFLISQLIVLTIKCQKMVKNIHHNFPYPEMTSLNFLICPTKSPKPKDMKRLLS